MRKLRWIAAAILLVLIGAGVFAYWFDLLPLPEVEDGDYPMRPVSAMEECERLELGGVTLGERVWWSVASDKNVVWVARDTNWKTIPDPEIKCYPKLKSSRALYGAIELGKTRIKPGEGRRFCCVVDESAGTGTGFDRLYFDANGDLDLTDDPVLAPMESQTSAASQTSRNTVFQPLTISFDFGPEYGERPVRILPLLAESDASEKCEIMLNLFAAEARKGKIQIGRHRFNALLGQLFFISGRFDKPTTSLHLTEPRLFEHRDSWQWWGREELSAFRLVDGRFYTIAATPTGDTLMVRRYRGELGTLRIEPGNRDIAEIQMSGWLASETTTVPVGQMPQVSGKLEKVRECEIPVGDYSPNEMRFRYGRLSFWITQNYHTEGKRHGATDNPWIYSIKIRKDRPFVLDFSNRPKVIFLGPAKDRKFKAGEEVEIETVLTDPVLGTMIRGLDDTSRKEKCKDGNNQTFEKNLSLAPTVKILDSAGKTLAEGTMPFG